MSSNGHPNVEVTLSGERLILAGCVTNFSRILEDTPPVSQIGVL